MVFQLTIEGVMHLLDQGASDIENGQLSAEIVQKESLTSTFIILTDTVYLRCLSRKFTLFLLFVYIRNFQQC